MKQYNLKKTIYLVISFILSAVILGSSSYQPVAAASGKEIGIATGTSLLWTEEEDLERRVRGIQVLGASWVRIEFNWAEIQAESPDKYRWGSYDRVIKVLRKYNLKVLATLVNSPAWARNEHCAALVSTEEAERKCSPGNVDEFGRFARSAVLRYNKSSIYAWEVWNEPNLTGHWKTARPNNTIFVDASAYARTANAAAAQIRKYQPRAFIVTGGLAPVYERRYHAGQRQSDYLRQLLPLLDHKLFNAVGVHPYSWPHVPGTVKDYNAFYTVNNEDEEYNLRTIMNNAGWGDRQIWATEFGASTKGKRLENPNQKLGPNSKRPDHVSEQKQARIIKDGVALWHQKPNVGPLFIHSDSDKWLMNRGNERGYGLRRPDGSKKPAYEALRQAIIELK